MSYSKDTELGSHVGQKIQDTCKFLHESKLIQKIVYFFR